MPSKCCVTDGINYNVMKQDLQDKEFRLLVYTDSNVIHTFKKELKCSVCASKLL